MNKTRLVSLLSSVLTSVAATGAVYDVEELAVNNLASNVFAQTIDNSGTVVVTTQFPFNQAIDLSYLDFDNEAFVDSLEDPEGAQQGNFSDEDYLTLITLIRTASLQNNPFTQRVAQFRSVATDGQNQRVIAGFDEISPALNDLTGSTQTVVRDSLNGQYFVGTGDDAFSVFTYVASDDAEIGYTLNDFRLRAFIQNEDVTIGLPSPDTLLGGYSEAYAVNQQLQVAGFGTVEERSRDILAVDNCADDDIRGDQPIEFCLWRLNYPTPSPPAVQDQSIILSQRSIRPLIWSLDSSNNVIDTQVYGLVFEPEEDDNLLYGARAFDINDQGIAVGFSDTDDIAQIGFRGVRVEVATIFQNGETIEFLDREDGLFSRANLINNNNWVVGTVSRDFNGQPRQKLFAYNIDTEESVFPNGFFFGSGTIPRDVNNNNIAVGEGEVEATNEAARERNAFIFDIGSNTFSNLNNLIACDSPYTLVDAVSINDAGEIIANARVRLPAKDPLGNDLLDEDGETTLVDTVVTVKLNPIANGEADVCEPSPDDTDTLERQGAASGWVWFVLLLLSVTYRRLVPIGYKKFISYKKIM